jgi:tetratricopeptide (TPR) repeat protein
MTTRAIKQALWLTLGLAVVNGFAAVNPGSATIRFLEQRVTNDPLDCVAWNRLSAAYVLQMRETGDLSYVERAEQSARKSLSAVSAAQNPGGLAVLAVAEFESHHFRDALRLAQQAYDIDPRNSGALATIGDSRLELGDYSEAERTYESLRADGTTPSVQARLARLEELKGNNQKAVELMRTAAASSGDAIWYRVRLGELYFRTGDFSQAEEQYVAARARRPDSYLVLEHLAELRAAQGNFNEAINLYEKVVDSVPRGEFLQALGDLYVFMGKPAEARIWHERALKAYLESVNEGNAHYYHHLAGFYSDSQENPAEALHWARKDLEVRHSVYAYESLAWALYKNGEFAAAAEEMSRALGLGTRDVHLLFHGAMIYSRAGDLERGSQLLKEALIVNPRYNSFHVHR